MPNFPASPVDGSESDDGLYTFYEPPGAWRRKAGNSLADRNSLEIESLRQRLDSKVDASELDVQEYTQLALDARRSRHQTVSVSASGDTPIDLAKGHRAHIPATSGTWTPVFLNQPSGGFQATVSVTITADNHQMVPPAGAVWKKGVTAPVLADYDATDLMVFEFTKLPFVDSLIMDWMFEGTAPDTIPDPITPPTITFTYSTDPAGSGQVALSSASVPQSIAVWATPDADVVSSIRFFVNHTGAIPAEGAEGDSYVGTQSAPFSLLGLTAGLANLYDTRVDPTGNDRADYLPNGTTTITAAPKLIDGTEPTATTVSFSTTNAPLGSDPVIDFQVFAYDNAPTSALVTVPDGVDRSVVVQAHYRVTNSAQSLTSMTLGGNALTNIAAATFKDGQLGGVWTGYINEANLSTGDLTLTPTFSATPGAASSIIYNVWVISNVATPTFGGHYEYENTSPGSPTTPSPSIASVPANSILLTSGSQADTAGTEMTVDIGTASATVELAGKHESRAAHVADSGVSATETANWTGSGKSYGVLTYLDYSASSGGGGVTPIIPGVPTVALTTPADNQIVATWAATTDAVSYQIRYSQGADPTVPNGAPLAATSPRTITGLIASQSYAVQVRAKSSTDHYSPWSATQWIVTTGSTAPPAEFSGKFLTSSSPQVVSYTEGSSYKGTDIFVPTWIRRRNTADTEAAVANMAIDQYVDEAIANWQSHRGRSAFIEQAGPRYVWTSKIGMLGLGNHNSKSTNAESAAQVLDMGKSGSTGNVNRDWVYEKLGTDLARTYRGFLVSDIFHISISHESNGPWNGNQYMGRNPGLIGQPGLVNATNADYGPEMGAALRKAGATGECADVHRLACEHIMEVIWSRAPGAILGMTPANPDGESIPPDQPPSANGTEWVYDAFPRESLGFKLDFLYPTLYSREAGSMQYISGNATVATNWRRKEGWLDNAVEYVARYGCAFGMLEIGMGVAVPGTNTLPDDIRMPSDNANYAFWELLFNHQLNDTSKWPNGLGMVNHWTKLRWQGKPPPMSGTYRNQGSYNLLEGLWGEYPAQVWPSDTNKFAGAPGDGTWYPRTRAWYQTNFPR